MIKQNPIYELVRIPTKLKYQLDYRKGINKTLHYIV